MIKSDLNFFIGKYLENRPLFFSLIRPQEAVLFKKHTKLKPPVLDYGCGDGFFAEVVFGKGKIDVGLDIKESRIDEAKKNGMYKKTVIYDGKKIPFPANHFETIISNCVMEHIPALNQSVFEINRVLTPGGYFIVTVMTDKWENYQFGARLFGDFYRSYMRKVQEHHNLLGRAKWRKTFESKGFKVVKEIGYLSGKASMWLDISHYLSFPSLISYKLVGKWNVTPKINKLLRIDFILSKIIRKFPIINNSAALFYILKKS